MNEQIHQARVSVVGAGLAGSECALQLAHRGIEVDLYEMRPSISTPAHKTDQMAELVCSNSFGNLNEDTAPGYLKFEAESMGSHILRIAKQFSVPAGAALGVDRERFASAVTLEIENHPRIRVHKQVITNLNQIQRPTIIATGPLTDPELAKSLQEHFGNDFLYFFDAIAPIVDADSIDMGIAWRADR
jgi:methylenetetrahydrofolate--tRNA-(uracil-5-)-methyltransferase